jgi:dTDP-4-amino-4,6-dideoxygalactose transaminase
MTPSPAAAPESPELAETPEISFARPDISEEEIVAVVETLRSGWLTSGPRVDAFERAFAAFIGAQVHGVAVSSGTAGLEIALQALGVGPGDEVITTCNTFTSTALSILRVGATPVLVDIDVETLNIDPDRVEGAVTARTRAVIPVHVGGLACDMSAIWDIAARHGLLVIEDAAHALPAHYGQQVIGAGPSDAIVFSFYATKPLTTGEGGMIVTRRNDIARACRILRLHGIDRDAFHRVETRRPWHYDVVAPGAKANMPEIAAAIGIEQLKKLPGLHLRRCTIASKYLDAFEGLPVRLPACPPQMAHHAWHLFILRLADEAPVGRDAFIARMASDERIQCSVHFIPLQYQRFWQGTLGIGPNDFPLSSAVFERVVSIPLHSLLSDHEVARICDAVKRLLSS